MTDVQLNSGDRPQDPSALGRTKAWLAKNGRFLAAGFIVFAAVLSACVVLVVPGQAIVVTRLGDPIRVVTQPGVAWKIPAPVESTIPVDLRLKTTSSGLQDVGTRDGLRILVQAYVAWQVPNDPGHIRQFLRAVQNQPDVAAEQLRSFMGSSLEITVSSFDLANLINTDENKIQLAQLETRLRERIDQEALKVYGINIRQVGIERLTLPAETLSATVGRMQAERATVAAEREAEGQRAAAEIVSNADRDARVVVAKAKSEAATIDSKARVESADIYGKAYADNRELYTLLRSLDTLNNVVGPNTRLILRTDAAPFRVLVDGPGGTTGTLPAPVQPPAGAQGPEEALMSDTVQPNLREAASVREPEGAWAQSLALSFRFLFIAVYVLGFAWAVSNVRIVPPDSRAVVLRFGSVSREESAGLLLAFPQPIEQVMILPSADRQIEYKVKSYAAPGVVIVSGAQALPGRAVLVSRDPRENAGMVLTGDMSVVHLDATLFYRITDATAYVLAADHVTPALERLFVASAVTVCGRRDLDTILVARPELETSAGTARAGRERLRTDLMNEVNRRLDELAKQGASLEITVGRVDLLPSIPGEAKAAFDSVLVVLQEAQTKVAQARTQAEQMMQGANQNKDRIVTDTEARAAEQITNAQTRTAAIGALAHGTQGIAGDTLTSQIYADRIGPLLGKAAQVVTTDGTGGAHLILPGTPR